MGDINRMLKSVITFAAIVAVVSAQAQTAFPIINDDFPVAPPTEERRPMEFVTPKNVEDLPIKPFEPIQSTNVPTPPVSEPSSAYQNPVTEACYNSIKATLMHVKSMAKAFDKAGGLGQLTEALEIFSQAKSAKSACSDVPFTMLAQYAPC